MYRVVACQHKSAFISDFLLVWRISVQVVFIFADSFFTSVKFEALKKAILHS